MLIIVLLLKMQEKRTNIRIILTIPYVIDLILPLLHYDERMHDLWKNDSTCFSHLHWLLKQSRPFLGVDSQAHLVQLPR